MGGRFYVYEHWRPDRDECFYVGMGHGRRANVMDGRHAHHRRIQAKLRRLGMCVEVRLVAETLTRDEAIAAEIKRIAFWRGLGVAIVNRTAGGDGSLDPAPDTRAKMRAAKVGRKLTTEHKAKIRAATRAALADPDMRQHIADAARVGRAKPGSRAKASASQKVRVRTKEHYEKVAAALRGKKLSPDHVAKMKAGHAARKARLAEVKGE